jgi:hypothetical protein
MSGAAEQPFCVAAVARKNLQAQREGVSSGLGPYRQAWRRWVTDLGLTDLKALVLDFDGTMVRASSAPTVLPIGIRRALSALLDGGMTLGVATGRTASAFRVLRASFFARQWPRIFVSYANGYR